MSYRYGHMLKKLNEFGTNQTGKNAFGFPIADAYIDDAKARAFSDKNDGVTVSAIFSQNSSKVFAGSSPFAPDMIAAFIPPMEVPATISNFIPCLCSVL